MHYLKDNLDKILVILIATGLFFLAWFTGKFFPKLGRDLGDLMDSIFVVVFVSFVGYIIIRPFLKHKDN